VLAGVEALRFASTRRVAGFGLDSGSAQATSSTYRRLSECLALDSLVVPQTTTEKTPSWTWRRSTLDHQRDPHTHRGRALT
jgi:hypothetical protein